MGMRIVWALYDTERDGVVCLFEAENLLVGYREQLLREAYETATAELPEDFIGDEAAMAVYTAQVAERNRLLDLGWERWRNGEVNSKYPRFVTQRYELWNSVPPNVERIIIHFDAI